MPRHQKAASAAILLPDPHSTQTCSPGSSHSGKFSSRSRTHSVLPPLTSIFPDTCFRYLTGILRCRLPLIPPHIPISTSLYFRSRPASVNRRSLFPCRSDRCRFPCLSRLPAAPHTVSYYRSLTALTCNSLNYSDGSACSSPWDHIRHFASLPDNCSY